jgi:DNA-directed RNA polymerase subunit M/transcription elongation factor TFIIS
MTTTLLPSMSGAPVANDWFCELSLNRSADECPNCKQLAMQFFAQILGEVDRENVFRCCACGSTWQF